VLGADPRNNSSVVEQGGTVERGWDASNMTTHHMSPRQVCVERRRVCEELLLRGDFTVDVWSMFGRCPVEISKICLYIFHC
jgi:hypothetical protein